MIQVWTDSDFAGCKATRKSTSGGAVMYGKHLWKSWSGTQRVIALSSGEAEFYAMVKGSSVGLGLVAMLKEFGMNQRIKIKSENIDESGFEVRTDASAAEGIAKRKGIGKIRHIDVSQLWIQEKVAEGVIRIVKVKGT